MWTKSYSSVYEGVGKEDIWNLWTDVKNWHLWNPGITYCTMDQPFAVGNHFTLKPASGPAVKISIVELVPGVTWTDCTKFPGAKMYGKHEMEEVSSGGLKLTTTMTITGPLSFIWGRLVAQGIVDKIPAQTENIVKLARQKHG